MPRASFQLKVVYAFWILNVLDPQYYLVRWAPSVILKAPTILLGLLALALMTKWPRYLYPLFLGLIISAAIPIPFAFNIGYARDGLIKLTVYYVLILATLTFVRHPRQLLPILYLLMFQYFWWAFHGGTNGLIRWHPTNGNNDGAGPLMAIGLGISYFFGMAATSRKVRLAAWFAAGLCMLSVVASFARGAVLATGLVVAYIWFRSPRKGHTTIAVAVGLVITLVGASVMFPPGQFWSEMESSFTQGTEEGTGADRWVLWTAAVQVWMTTDCTRCYPLKPIFGAGFRNFGPTAADIFEAGEVGGEYDQNPLRLYERSLHSIYLQTLSELGLAGVIFYALLLVDFWRRNRHLRTAAAGQRWRELTGNEFALRPIAMGIECAMIAYLATGFFYDQLEVSWPYVLLAINVVLYQTVVGGGGGHARGRAPARAPTR